MTDWDRRFLDVARIVSTWSKDPSTQTGAVIVRPNKSVCSLGFNGFPQNMSDESTLYADRDEKYSRIIHCEMNALLFSSELIRGYTLYTWPFASCDRCVVHMLQAGVQRFVFPALPEDKKERWEKPLRKTLEYLQESGVNWREI